MTKKILMGAAIAAGTMIAGCCDRQDCQDPARCAPQGACGDACAKPADGAEAAARDPAEKVVSVCGRTITRGELDKRVDNCIEKAGDCIPAAQIANAREMIARHLAQQFLVETALAAKATELGYKVSPEEIAKEEARFLANYRSQTGKADATFDEVLAMDDSRPAADARKAFEDALLINKMIEGEVLGKDTEDYTAEAARQIADIEQENAKCLTDEQALAKIRELEAQLAATPEAEKAAKFAALAREHSACPSGASGGDLGEFGHGKMVKEFDETAFALEPGRISGPVKTRFGYHLVQTVKKTPESAPGAGDDKVQASHILVKIGRPRPVPTVEEVVKQLKNSKNRRQVREFIERNIAEAQPQCVGEFQSLVPEVAKPAEK